MQLMPPAGMRPPSPEQCVELMWIGHARLRESAIEQNAWEVVVDNGVVSRFMPNETLRPRMNEVRDWMERTGIVTLVYRGGPAPPGIIANMFVRLDAEICAVLASTIPGAVGQEKVDLFAGILLSIEMRSIQPSHVQEVCVRHLSRLIAGKGAPYKAQAASVLGSGRLIAQHVC